MKIKIDPVKFAPAIAFLYKGWSLSLRLDIDGYDEFMQLHKSGRPVMFSLWHQDLFSLITIGYVRKLPMVTMASDSKDGQIISEVLERIGFEVTRGSSTRGGLKAMLGMARIMRKKGKIGALTVDGPKGPKNKIKPGVLAIAQKIGAAIVPVRCYVDKPVVFEKSWDKFEVPMPFASCKVFFGPAFEVIDQKLDEQIMASEALRLEKVMAELGS